MTDEQNANTNLANEGGTTGDAAGQPATKPGSGDPLDAISDPTELRSKAKGYRAERNRLRDTPAAPASQPAGEFITKQDHLRTATKEAKDLVPAEIRDSWDALIEYVPAKHKSAETPKEIAKAMEAARAAYLVDHPAQDTTAADTQAALQTDTGTRGAPASANVQQNKADEDPRFAKPKGPTDWYNKEKK